MKFKPTTDMIKAAKAVFIAMAHVETVRPIVRGYQHELINYMRPMVANEHRRLGKEGEITTPERTYLMDDNDAKWYYAECDKKAALNGFTLPGPGYCPLLMAEDLQRKAEHVLVEVMAEHLSATTGKEKITINGLLCLGLAKYRNFIELSLKLLAPFCGDSAGIMKEYGLAK